MENVMEIPKNQATCIEATARLLNTSYKDLMHRQ